MIQNPIFKDYQLIRNKIKINHMKIDELFLLLYVNDGAGLFSSISDAILGSNIIFHLRVRLALNIMKYFFSPQE